MAEAAHGAGSQRTARLAPLLTLGSAVALAGPVAQRAGGIDALVSFVPLRCPLHLLTGLRCPTCGLGHALAHAAAGDLATAWAHHPLGPPLLVAALLGATCHACAPATASALWRRARDLPGRHPVATWLCVAGYASFGLLRL